MNAAELKARIARRENANQAAPGRLELVAAERDLQRFLAGKAPASEKAAGRLAEIMLRERLPVEEIGLGYAEDPMGVELACRNPVQRLAFRARRAIGSLFEG